MHHGIHHFHGTPVWGSAGDVHRIAVSGAGAFVSYVRPDQIAASIQHAQVVGIDNGAFSAWVTEVLEWRYKAIQRSGANDE